MLYRILMSVIWKDKDFVRYFIEVRTIEYLKWEIESTIEHLHQSIYAIVYQQNRILSSDIYLKVLSNSRIAHLLTIIHIVSTYFQRLDSGNEVKALLTKFLAEALFLTQNGGTSCYVQLLYHIVSTCWELCLKMLLTSHQTIYYSLISKHSKAVHDVYMPYCAYYKVDWPMNNQILLTHLEIPQVQYALLSCLIRSYTLETPEFIHPFPRIASEHQMARLILCRMAKSSPSCIPSLIYKRMAYLTQLSRLIVSRILFLIYQDPRVWLEISQFLNVYIFMTEFIEEFPHLVISIGELVCKFSVCMKVASLLVESISISISANKAKRRRHGAPARFHDNYAKLAFSAVHILIIVTVAVMPSH